jgi:copper chaperone CopZ
VNRIPTFENFNRTQFVSEAYELVKDHMTYDEFDELIGEGFFSFIKGLFSNPLQKRKLDKLGEDLLKTKIELMRLEIEEDAVNSIKAQLNTMKRGDTDYETTSVKVDVADRAKATKIKSLQDRESAIVDQMDMIGNESEKLQKYVDKVKFEIRIKANDATIRIADGEVERILRDLKSQDMKAVKDLDKELK